MAQLFTPGADALYRFIDSDVFYYEFLPEAAR